METGVTVEEFITIVPVGENKPAVLDPAFVTVLTVGPASGAAEVTVRRPRGARLGLGLKFEGGSAAAEKVRRLLVQSCAEDSPAAKASTPWGKLIPGDEILAIDGVSVSELTRIECVRRLKDSDESLLLLVRHLDADNNSEQTNMESKETSTEVKLITELSRPTTLPPPVPPRKLGKKHSFKDKTILQTLGEQNALVKIDSSKDFDNVKETVITQHPIISTMNKLSRKSSFDSHIHRQNKESFAYLRKGSPEEVRRLVRRLSDGKAMPPEADIYIDLLSNEWERCLVLADAESDDTGSSISTVVDRLGSMASSVENSIPSTPIMQPKSIDIQKVLNSIENIDTNILKDMQNSARNLDKSKEVSKDSKTEHKKIISNVVKNQDIIIQNSVVSENIKPTSKNTENNDKVVKQEIMPEKPKPMPRNTKVERSASDKKRRPIPIPELPAAPVPEPLLTPTKKTCIESWLQRSEAEMNNKLEDKLEEKSAPEVLPRLIDFVPKTQYKECGTETTTCIRPTAPPPPPPAETREDGSGASLDTIGELDESCDVTDNAKTPIENEPNKRKSLFERNFWDDRVNKSDAEDKSLSNDETPMPSCPRQPPDGVETPSDAIEKTPDLPTRLPPRISSGWSTNRSRYSYSSRTQDARSEASVKDKIAMFSVDIASSSDRLDKCGTLPVRSHSTLRKNSTPYISSYTEVSSLDRRLTKSQDNLDETPRSFQRNSDRPEVLGALENTNSEIRNNRFNQTEIKNKPLFYGSTTTLPSDTSFTRPTYHMRSVSDDNSNKNMSTHKSNLEYLIEQRKKSMSKLRGLVIPEVQAPIVDLPEIKVQDPVSKTFLHNSLNKVVKKDSKVSNSSAFTDNKWKTNFLPNNIPKYSPAFKRKSLQVYTPSSLSKESTPERKFIEKIETLSRVNNYSNPIPTKPIKSLFEFSKNSSAKCAPVFNRDLHKRHFNSNIQDFKNVEIKICTTTDIVDSDNDSAMSSTQSSYRSSASSPMHIIDNNIESDNSRLSPRISHYNSYSRIKSEIPNKSITADKNCEQYVKRSVFRSVSSDTNISLSSSAGSAATSGSQASCSSLESSVADSDKRKVSKIYNVDNINRRNIVASAKCRSGRDVKLESPVVETKFSHESYNRSPSPIQKASDRLSTLTPAVSAIAAKGENRRRSKIVVDTDSDSDAEMNIRQRKPDYKNPRLKRNSSTSNKVKNNDVHQEIEKIEKTSTLIKDEKLKDVPIKYLENQERVKSATLHKKNSFNGNNINKDINSERLKEKNNGISSIESKREIVKVSNNIKSMVDTNRDVKKSPKNNTHCLQLPTASTEIFQLKKGTGSGVGLILAGGVDCEAKDVTVHRVLEDGIAAKAGIKRGSKVISINNHSMSGLTHAQSVSILKEQRCEVVIEIENEVKENKGNTKCGSEHAESKGHQIDEVKTSKDKSDCSIVTVLLEKAGGGAGLGFGLDGGRDSPQGDRPLTIKKLFAGGAAAQSGRIVVGAELLSAGGQSMEGFTRTQAWAALKALPAGQVALVLRNPQK
ncbi:uncharacterized protein LOC126769402 isoform X1 [Nymphalis io]|uniref:uncharacterized protein LOC126769402 isoform X1 n=1 Tax=Inachis io TaxID=171585 RepID=UPI0021696CE1|nr:uncharacterized protein LOC126769402 isoform X1 [Nymphalis io]